MSRVRHVFVETNWVFDCIVPEYQRTPQALRLLRLAQEGKIALHLPAISLREAADTMRLRSEKPKDYAKLFGEFRRFERSKGRLTETESEVVARFLDDFVKSQEAARADIDARLASLAATANVDCFALDDEMLKRTVDLRAEIFDVTLQPFDEAILGGVIVRAERLQQEGVLASTFCSLDEDLSPRKKKNRSTVRSNSLDKLYRTAGIEFRFDFDVRIDTDDEASEDER